MTFVVFFNVAVTVLLKIYLKREKLSEQEIAFKVQSCHMVYFIPRENLLIHGKPTTIHEFKSFKYADLYSNLHLSSRFFTWES
jgi:hypothetical protein